MLDRRTFMWLAFLSGLLLMPRGARAQGGSAELTPDAALSTQRTGFVACAAAGPDLIMGDLPSTIRYSAVGDITAYGIGTTVCNIGTERVNFIGYTNQHPLILQNLYRLKDDRFEQIGMSWMIHTFYAASQSFCSPCNDPTDGSQLGVGCSDATNASSIGQQNMSPRSTVNADAGYFPHPWSGPAPSSSIDRRLQVHAADLDPALNAGARYFMEGHLVNPDDAQAQTDDNNASHREVTVAEFPPEVFRLFPSPGKPTHRGEPAIRAWSNVDATVRETDLRIPGEGLFILAAKATDLSTGLWRYEYALQNLNSHRSAGSFSICFTGSPVVENVGFHDVDYHSGEIYDLSDWTANVTDGGFQVAVNWSAQSYAANPDANALRFGTIYNFRFDAGGPPDSALATIGLFRPGDPPRVWAHTIGPPEACANPLDADHDGEWDCLDLCPETPPGVCTCQGIGMCCAGCMGPCWDSPRDICVAERGTPDKCGDPRCKNGCPLLDMDNDGDRDLADFAGLQRCFSGLPGEFGYVAPTRECVNRLDVDGDHAIGLGDYKQLFDLGLLGQ